jgi:hypothetical protein
MTPEEWLSVVTKEASSRAIATKLGVSHTTVIKWRLNGPPAAVALRIAREFDTDPLDALIAAGVLTSAQASSFVASISLAHIPTWKLTEELHRRALKTKEG